MKNFAIKELEILCGVKAHTIRVWENRYSAFNPQRTNGNARRYAVDELRKVLHLSLLNKNGHRISLIAKMRNEELQQRITQLKGEQERWQRAINELILCMYEMDSLGFESQLNDCYLAWSDDIVIDEIIFPFLTKVELLSQGKQLNEEHLVVTAIRKKMHWSIERLKVPASNGKTVLLFLSSERQLDLLLLYIYYHLKKAGCQVMNLGVDISIKNLEELVVLKQPHCLVTYLPKRHPAYLQQLSVTLKASSPKTQLLIIDHEPLSILPQFDNIRLVTVDEAINYMEQGHHQMASMSAEDNQ
jgi:DNA-binding transcriptional MerR regulator